MHLLRFLSLVPLALALAVHTEPPPDLSHTEPPRGALVVGGSGHYSKIQDAVDALSTTSTTEQAIFINPGTYKEQVYIPKRAAALSIYGYTTNTSSYADNKVTITQGLSQDTAPNNDMTATLRAWSTNFKLYNVNLVNTRGKGSQALALSAQADRQGYYACQFKGYQDTILANTGSQVYARCYIEGATDFIFGQSGIAWFDGVTIGVLDASTGYITASGRSSSSDPNYFVINKSSVRAASGNSVSAGAYYLGRPWGNYARVVFQNSELSKVVNAAGWRVWNTDDERTEHVAFAEYHNSGAGAKGKRADFSSELDAPVEITQVLGSAYEEWVDASYLS